MTQNAAGWYPDPFRDTGERYWDGGQWTALDRAAAVAVSTAPPAGASQSPPTAALPLVAYPPPAGYSPPPAGYSPPPGLPTGPGYPIGPPPPPRPSAPHNRSFVQANSASLLTVLVCAVYGVIAFYSSLVILGIFPIVLTARAFQRKERLAPLAAVCAGLIVVLTIYLISRTRF